MRAAASARELCRRAVAARQEGRWPEPPRSAGMGYSPPPLTQSGLQSRSGDAVAIPLRDLTPGALFDRAAAESHDEEEPGASASEPLEWHAEGPPEMGGAAAQTLRTDSSSSSCGDAATAEPACLAEAGSCVSGGSSGSTAPLGLLACGSSTARRGERDEDLTGPRIWGLPPAAPQLLQELKDFQTKEMAENFSSGKQYVLLPLDLLRLQSASTTPAAVAMAAAQAAAADGGDAEEGKDQEASDGCGAHFFWLEALYDFHSGQQAPSVHAACRVPGASAGTESVRWSLFPRMPSGQNEEAV